MSADAAAQTRHVLETIKSVIETAGGTMDDVTFNSIFIRDWADYAALNQADTEVLPRQAAPASRRGAGWRDRMRWWRSRRSARRGGSSRHGVLTGVKAARLSSWGGRQAGMGEFSVASQIEQDCGHPKIGHGTVWRTVDAVPSAPVYEAEKRQEQRRPGRRPRLSRRRDR